MDNVILWFTTYHRLLNSNTTGATSGVGTTHPSGALECTLSIECGSFCPMLPFLRSVVH